MFTKPSTTRGLFAALLTACALTFSAAPALAEEGDEDKVVIKKEQGEQTIYEYRNAGRLVAIKVVPKNGKPYFLVPADGGDFNDLEDPSELIPQWKLFEWK